MKFKHLQKDIIERLLSELFTYIVFYSIKSFFEKNLLLFNSLGMPLAFRHELNIPGHSWYV